MLYTYHFRVFFMLRVKKKKKCHALLLCVIGKALLFFFFLTFKNKVFSISFEMYTSNLKDLFIYFF